MKKALVFALAAVTLLICGCEIELLEMTTTEVKVETTLVTTETTVVSEIAEPVSNPMSFMFLSGAGGWRTEIILHENGSFNGEHYDSEMGSTGDGYPYGTCYICKFTGKFKNFERINDYTYSMSIDYINTEHKIGEIWIEDGIQYIASGPYGLDGGKDFLLYTPDTPVSELPMDFMIWMYAATDVTDTLDCYAIRNLANDQGFAQPKW